MTIVSTPATPIQQQHQDGYPGLRERSPRLPFAPPWADIGPPLRGFSRATHFRFGHHPPSFVGTRTRSHKSPNGTLSCQLRVKQHECNECRATLGNQLAPTPQRAYFDCQSPSQRRPFDSRFSSASASLRLPQSVSASWPREWVMPALGACSNSETPLLRTSAITR